MVKKLTSKAVENPFNLAGKTLKAGVYHDTRVNPSINTGSLVIDLSLGNAFDVALNQSVSSMTISGAPASGTVQVFAIQFTADGTSRTIAWPASVRWANNASPILTATAGKVDTFVFYTDDGGTSYYGFITGQNS